MSSREYNTKIEENRLLEIKKTLQRGERDQKGENSEMGKRANTKGVIWVKGNGQSIGAEKWVRGCQLDRQE